MDVILGFCRLAYKKEYGDDPFDFDKHLKDEWHSRFEDLLKRVQMQDDDSGTYLAGLFIGRIIKSF